MALSACSNGVAVPGGTPTGSTVLRTERHVAAAVAGLGVDLATVAAWDDRSRPILDVQAQAVAVAQHVADAREAAAGAVGAPAYAGDVQALLAALTALHRAADDVAGCLLDCPSSIDAARAAATDVTDRATDLTLLLDR